MKARTRNVCVVLTLVGCLGVGAAQGQETVTGNWLGTLHVQGMELRLMFKITRGESKGDFATATSFNFAEDVLAGVEFLKTRVEIDPKRIGLIAPMVAERSGDVAFLVLLSGPAVTGEEIILLQSELIQRTMGVPEFTIARTRELNASVFEIIRTTEGDEETEMAVRAVLDGLPTEYAQIEETISPVVLETIAAWLDALVGT